MDVVELCGAFSFYEFHFTQQQGPLHIAPGAEQCEQEKGPTWIFPLQTPHKAVHLSPLLVGMLPQQLLKLKRLRKRTALCAELHILRLGHKLVVSAIDQAQLEMKSMLSTGLFCLKSRKT